MVGMLRKAFAHTEIYPLIVCVGIAGLLGVGALTRAALRYPDVVWDHKGNPRPWETVKQNEQVKLYASHSYEGREELPKY